MAILTLIDGIPLFTLQSQAEAWGSKYGLQGYHTHDFQGQVGYMAGSSHSDAITKQNSTTPIEVTQAYNIQPTVTTTTTTSGGGGGGSY